jgi:medium-chain acyl-[acyl-carrier-protein] hydrolase
MPGHQERYTVRTYDIDVNKRMTAPALLRLMNEAAMQHVLKLKVSVWDLEAHHLGWVILRLDLYLHRLPLLGEEIEIVTYPSGFERMFTYRDYRVVDGEGNPVAQATSTWILMHTDTRRPARLPDWVVARAEPLLTTADFLPRPASKLREWQAAENQLTTTVGWHDLDFNWHLNNSHYLRLLLDALPQERLTTGFPQRISLHYKAEANLGDLLVAESGPGPDNSFQHRLRRGEEVLALAETVWPNPLT